MKGSDKGADFYFQIWPLCLFFLFLNFFFYSPLLAQGADAQAYLRSLSDKAERLQIAYDRQWLLLLHYKKNFRGTYKSSAGNPDFFYSAEGRFDPEKELLANLKAFIKPKGAIDEEHALCKFPARFKWLKDELDIDGSFLPKTTCKKYETFKAKLRARSLSMVFVSGSANEAATLFGHTFIRFKYHEEKKEYLDQTLSFVADLDTSFFPVVIAKGLSGAFRGVLDFRDFDFRRWEYNLLGNRNFWEIELDLNPKEIQRLIDHLWEISSARFDYYFLNANCAFYNAYFLEVARPQLKLTPDSSLFVTPAYTIRELLEYDEIIKKAIFYPANDQEFRAAYKLLSKEEKKVFFLLTEDPFADLPQNPNIRPELILSAAFYSLWLNVDPKRKFYSPQKQRIYKNLARIAQRNALPIESYAKPNYTNPSIGHKSRSFSIGKGSGSRDSFVSIQIKPAFHELLDSPLGYSPFTEVSALLTEIRYYSELESLLLEQLVLARVISLYPIQTKLIKPSWLVDIGLKSLRREFADLNSNTMAFYFEWGYGYSASLNFLSENFIIYLLGDIYSETSSYFGNKIQVAPGPRAGLVWRFSDTFALHSILQYRYFYNSAERKENLIFTNGINLALGDQIALEAHSLHFLYKNLYEVKVNIKLYF